MKIALIRRKYTPYGGMERHTDSLAKSLSADGHEVHIYAEEWPQTDYSTWHKVDVIRGSSIVEMFSFAGSVKKLLIKQEFDVIHSMERTYYQDILFAGEGCHKAWLRRRRSIDNPFVWYSHAINPRQRAILHLERKTYLDPKLKIVIAISENVKKELIDHYAVSPDKIRVIHNGFDESLLDPNRSKELPAGLEHNKNAYVVLFVGSDFKRKNLAGAIRALALLNDSSAYLWVVGKGNTSPYKKLAHRLKIENNVIFLGPCPDPVPFYAHAKLFLLPTLYDAFGNACLEAAAFGLPVVTSRDAGFSELIRPGKNGFIIENPLDSGEIADKMKKARVMSNVVPYIYPTIRDNVTDMVRLYRTISPGVSSKGSG